MSRRTTVSRHSRRTPSGGRTTVSRHNRNLRDIPKMRRNVEKNGIELKFPEKPSEEVRELLKSNGFRWSRYNQVWYTKHTAGKEAFATKLAEGQVETLPVSSTPSTPRPRQARRKFKYLAIPTGKRKPKSVGKNDMERYLKHQPEFVNRVWDKVFKYPAEWTAEEARRRIKAGHQDVRIVGGAKASDFKVSRLPAMRQRIDNVYKEYPPSMYRVVVLDKAGNEYKIDTDRKLRRVTAPALTEINPTPLERLATKGKVGIKVQPFDSSNRSRGTYIRGLKDPVLFEEL